MNQARIAVVALIALAGCAGPPPNQQEIPAGLQTPPGQVLFLETLAFGVQIYECMGQANPSPSYAWSFRAPEAALVNRSGQGIGRHFAGPTWELADGSSVTGALQASDPGPSTEAIPWLLLRAKSTSGTGALSNATYIQRVRTKGGKAPDLPCTAATLGQTERVSYSAHYYFYRNAP